MPLKDIMKQKPESVCVHRLAYYRQAFNPGCRSSNALLAGLPLLREENATSEGNREVKIISPLTLSIPSSCPVCASVGGELLPAAPLQPCAGAPAGRGHLFSVYSGGTVVTGHFLVGF